MSIEARIGTAHECDCIYSMADGQMPMSTPAHTPIKGMWPPAPTLKTCRYCLRVPQNFELAFVDD